MLKFDDHILSGAVLRVSGVVFYRNATPTPPPTTTFLQNQTKLFKDNYWQILTNLDLQEDAPISPMRQGKGRTAPASPGTHPLLYKNPDFVKIILRLEIQTVLDNDS